MSLLPGLLHIYAKNKHVVIIEKSICTIKEHEKSTCRATPLKIYTSIMKRSLIEGVVDILNMLPPRDRVSDTLSPSKIVEGRLKLDMGQKKIAFG